MSTTPSTKYASSEPSELTAELPPPSSQTSSMGQGVGVGSAPGACGSPAETGLVGTNANSAHASAQDSNSFLKVVSPVIEVVKGQGRFAAKAVNPILPTDPDLVLFRTLAAREDYDSLTQLCRERLREAPDNLTRVRWVKDRAIVEALQGNYAAAYDLLLTVYSLAQNIEGAPRGKYELELGITLFRLHRPALALDRYGLAYRHSRTGGDRLNCARVDTARAQVLVTRGEYFKALHYLDRAEEVASEFRDYRLLADVAETKQEAYEALSRIEGA